MTRRHGALPLFLVMLFATMGAPAGDAPEVIIHGPPSGWATRFASPLRFEVRHGAGDLATTLGARRYQVRNRFALSGGPSEFVEATLFLPYGTEVEWSLPGATGSGYASPNDATLIHDGGYFLCVNGACYREVQSAIASTPYPSDWRAQILPAAELPRRWQAYAGLSVSLVLDESDARSLDREQREALRLWLAWQGGRLWLIGRDGEGVLREWGWKPLGPTAEGVSGLSVGTGIVFCRETADAESMLNAPFSPDGDLLNTMGLTDTRAMPMDLGKDLDGFSIGIIVTCLVMLGVVLGPVNYWYVRRRGNVLLFYLVTPLVAGLGSLAIIGGSLLSEGGTRCRQVAVLYHQGDGNDAFVIDCYGVRPGLLGLTLSLPEETLVIPERHWGAGNVVAEVSGRGTRVRGLLRPRTASRYTLARPAAGRMRVVATWDKDGGCTVENGLGYDLRWVLALNGIGRLAWARDIPAGATVQLETSRPPEDIAENYADTPGAASWSGPVASVAAEASGLPYLEDGGLGAGRMASRYFYVGVEPREGGHE